MITEEQYYKVQAVLKGRNNNITFGDPPAPHLEHLLNSLLVLYQKLKVLSCTYYNGKIRVIDKKGIRGNA